MSRTHQEALAVIQRERLVAILRGISMEHIPGVVQALVDGGVKALEFTYDHNSPEDIAKNQEKIRYAVEHFGDRVVVGCGTALSVAEVEATYEAGGELVITPSTDVDVIKRTRELGMVSMPGALTPTEVVTAWNAGADIVKIFPSSEFGLGYLKAIRAPLGFIPMSAVGGVKPENVAEYLNAGIAGFGVGSQLVLSDAVKRGDYDAIRARALEFTTAIAAWEASK
ncbi:MAG: thiamine phosphate synthase [Firmicutes bacterium]|nr:thiamine phosphate synthase [Bacillota bacterium]MBO6269932.1 thiamine phosphate synthase [Clostridium sp.]